MPINSRSKGKRGELEWCQVCKEHGYDVHRSAQHCGNTGEAADCVGLPYIHQEIKRVENLNIHKAIEQATRDSEAAGRCDVPIVAHRRNGTKWLVTMRAEDWFEMYNAWRDKQEHD